MNAIRIGLAGAFASLALAAQPALGEAYHPVVNRLQNKLEWLDHESTRNAWDTPIGDLVHGPPNLTREHNLHELAATLRELTGHLRARDTNEAKEEATTIVAALTSLSEASWHSDYPARVTAPLKVWDKGGEPTAWEHKRVPALLDAKAAYEELKGEADGQSGKVPHVVFRIARYKETHGRWNLDSNMEQQSEPVRPAGEQIQK